MGGGAKPTEIPIAICANDAAETATKNSTQNRKRIAERLRIVSLTYGLIHLVAVNRSSYFIKHVAAVKLHGLPGPYSLLLPPDFGNVVQ